MTPIEHQAERPVPAMPVLVATATRLVASEKAATRTPRILGSPDSTRASRSSASSTLRSAGRAATAGIERIERHWSHSVRLGQPDPVVGLRERRVVAGVGEGLRHHIGLKAPRPHEPLRWSRTTRMPMPAVVADENDSTSPA